MDAGNTVSIDFCEVAGLYVLVVIDDYSRFSEVEIVHSTAAKAVIPKLDCIFAAHGVSEVVKSNNGPPFNGHEFARFADYLGFVQRKVTALWPEANGEVDKFMKTCAPLQTGSNKCISFFATIVALFIALQMWFPGTVLFG